MPPKRSTIQNIQILRGLAALAVVIAHAAAQFPGAGIIPRIDATQAGVDVFFVISGFIMVYVTEQRRQTCREFLLSRIVRVVPNYWFYTILTCALVLVAPAVFRETSFNMPHLVLSLLFIAHQNPAIPGSASPLLRPGWTLNFEMFFYLLFSLSFVAWEKRVRVTTVVITTLVTIGVLFPVTSVVYTFYTNGIMLEFVFGMLLAVLYLRGMPKVPGIVPVLFMLSGILTMIAMPWNAERVTVVRALCFGVPAVAIVTASLLARELRDGFGARLLTRMGDASYTVYLSHPFILAACRVAATKLRVEPQSLAAESGFIVVATFIAIMAGYLAYQLVEVRLIKIARVLVERRVEKPEQVPVVKQEELA
jgi:peptidoglycan/LPS O-acetylase OafA/YrhL